VVLGAEGDEVALVVALLSGGECGGRTFRRILYGPAARGRPGAAVSTQALVNVEQQPGEWKSTFE